jgi:hypothetical protein
MSSWAEGLNPRCVRHLCLAEGRPLQPHTADMCRTACLACECAAAAPCVAASACRLMSAPGSSSNSCGDARRRLRTTPRPQTPDHPGPARARGHAGPAGGDAAARPAAAAPHQLGGPAATGVAHHHPHPSSAARLATRLRQRLLGPSLFSSRALRPCRCRHESLDSLHHLSHDGFMHSWLPSYANPAKVRPDSVI